MEFAYAGGIVGCNYQVVNCCYNIGVVSSSDCAGGITGNNSGDAVLSNCYYLNTAENGNGYDDRGTHRYTIEQLKLQSAFDGFDFECVDTGFKPNEEVEVVLRPEDIDITTPDNVA